MGTPPRQSWLGPAAGFGWVVPRESWRRALWVQFPVNPGCGLLLVLVGWSDFVVCVCVCVCLRVLSCARQAWPGFVGSLLLSPGFLDSG